MDVVHTLVSSKGLETPLVSRPSAP
jgi:hypothetical protein